MSIREGELVYEIEVQDIFADFEWNIRDKDSLDVSDLQRAIRQNGQEQPGLVCLCTPEEKEKTGKTYFLMAGFRRFKAITMEKLPTYKAFIRSGATDHERSMHNFKENQARAELNIYDESKYIGKLINEGYTEQMIMDELGLSRSWVQPRAMLHRMCAVYPDLIELARANKLTQADIRSLNGIADMEAQHRTIQEMKKGAEHGIKIKIDRSKNKTKRDRATMYMERTKVACEALISFAYHQKINIHPWAKALAWRNGKLNDLELLEVLDEINKDCTTDPDFKELIEDMESYSDDIESFYVKLLTLKQDYQNRSYERPVNGIPEKC